MIPNIGPLEIAIVLVIALIVFGPKKLPQLGRSLGSGITEFRNGLTDTSTGDEQPEELSSSEGETPRGEVAGRPS